MTAPTGFLAAFTEMAQALARANWIGTHFTCTEADSIAKCLALGGHVDEAVAFLMDHANGDSDVFDQHIGFEDSGAARQHLRELCA